jgi:hypothetical protein
VRISQVVTNFHGSFELRMQWSNAEESGSCGGTLRGIAQENEGEVILHCGESLRQLLILCLERRGGETIKSIHALVLSEK